MSKSSIEKLPSDHGAHRSGRARTRLGFEALENRWTLSAAAQDFTMFALPLVPITIDAVEMVQPIDAPQPIAIGVEGGFIPIIASSHDGTLVVSGGKFSGAVLQLDGNASVTLSIGARAFSHYPSSTGGIQPITFVPVENPPGLKPSVDPIGSDESPRRSERSEGGSIPIETILAKARQAPEWRSEPRGLTARNREGTSEKNEPLSLNSSAEDGAAMLTGLTQSVAPFNSGISGEWARAMIFELADDEQAAFVSRSSADATNSIVAEDGHDEAGIGAARSGSADDGTPADSGANDLETTRAQRVPDSHGADQSPAGQPRQLNAGVPGLQRPSPFPLMAVVGAAPVQSTIVRAAPSRILTNPSGLRAVELITRDDQPVATAARDDDASTAGVEGLPLIVFVALEWVAVRRWRRSSDESATALAGPPKAGAEAR